MHDALARAFADGATVVTPNRRLARHLIEEHDRAQIAAGKRAWTAARVLPWSAWVGEMTRESVAGGALPPLVILSVQASAWLWREAIDADATPGLDSAAMAAAAAEAWQHVHAYGAGAESWRAWAGGDDEPAAFARWAERYRAALRTHGAIDVAEAAERVGDAAASMPSWRGRRFAFAGFLASTPQQRRVGAALVRAGAVVDDLPTLADEHAVPKRASFASPAAEVDAALAWARDEVEHRGKGRVGIVVPDLAQRLAEVRRRAIDALGVPDGEAPRAQAWNVSLGAPIDGVPLVSAAIDLITLAWPGLPAGRAAALLRSPYLPDAGGVTRDARAAVERPWLDTGVDSARVGDAIAALHRRDAALAERLSAVRAIAAARRRETRHGWVDAWREALAAAGWPGNAPLASHEHQAKAALDEHLVAFAALDAVSSGRGGLAAHEAIGAFAEVLATAPFQPELPPAPIQILGLYEAVGLPFDSLWVAGMDNATLPRAPRPHPLLPVRWQREHGVPLSDAARELADARHIATWLLRAAPVVVVSHAATVDDRPAAPATLFPRGAPLDHVARADVAAALFAARPPRERVVEHAAPALGSTERLRGGSGIVAAQSDCPFQALAARRWRADPWPEPAVGLTSWERGTLVHEALAAFWRVVRSRTALAALFADPVASRDALARAANTAIATIDAARWRRIPPAVRALEGDRLAHLLTAWLHDVEMARPSFDVLDVEHEQTLAMGPLALALRFDRVDTLADGGVAIIDYKTGGVPSITRWTRERPEATQLALYTLAWRAAHPDTRVRAAVLAKVKRGESKAVGIYADDAARFSPPARSERQSPVVDWPALEATWGSLMNGLADAFVRGESAVAPRERAVCRSCARHALCRIGDTAADDEEGDA